MDWDWDRIYREREKRQRPERERLLGMSDAEAEEKLSTPDRYQRMRYQREIEAAEWLAEVRRKLPPPNVVPIKKRYASRKNKIVYDRD